MWTGDKVISKTISQKSLEDINDVLRRPVVIWDNEHANDYDQKRVFLGPYSGRSPEIIRCLRGVMTNPNCEYGANFVAIHTLAQWSKCRLDGTQPYRNANDAVTADIRLEISAGADHGDDDVDSLSCDIFDDDSAGDIVYEPKKALARAVKAWLPEFSRQKTVWGPMSKPQVVLTSTPALVPAVVSTMATATSTSLVSSLQAEPLSSATTQPSSEASSIGKKVLLGRLFPQLIRMLFYYNFCRRFRSCCDVRHLRRRGRGHSFASATSAADCRPRDCERPSNRRCDSECTAAATTTAATDRATAAAAAESSAPLAVFRLVYSPVSASGNSPAAVASGRGATEFSAPSLDFDRDLGAGPDPPAGRAGGGGSDDGLTTGDSELRGAADCRPVRSGGGGGSSQPSNADLRTSHELPGGHQQGHRRPVAAQPDRGRFASARGRGRRSRRRGRRQRSRMPWRRRAGRRRGPGVPAERSAALGTPARSRASGDGAALGVSGRAPGPQPRSAGDRPPAHRRRRRSHAGCQQHPSGHGHHSAG